MDPIETLTQETNSTTRPDPASTLSTAAATAAPTLTVQAPSKLTTPPSATLEDISQLREKVRVLLSDFSILRGEFQKEEFGPDHHNTRAFAESGYVNSLIFLQLQDDIDSLLNEVKKKGRATHNQPTNSWRPAELQKYENLSQLYHIHRKEIQVLREKLESMGRGAKGVYDYKLDIVYQAIGNQELPQHYKKRKTTKRKSDTMPNVDLAKKAKVTETATPVAQKQKKFQAKAASTLEQPQEKKKSTPTQEQLEIKHQKLTCLSQLIEMLTKEKKDLLQEIALLEKVEDGNDGNDGPDETNGNDGSVILNPATH